VITTEREELLKLWTEHAEHLRNRMGVVTGYTAPLDDLLQELFLRVYRKAEKLRPDYAQRYMMRAASNLARDYLRAESRERARTYEITPGPTPFDDCLAKERLAFYHESVAPLVENLPARNRQAIRAYMEGRTRSDTAKELGIPSTTLRSREIAGLKRLREQLGYSSNPRNGYRS